MNTTQLPNRTLPMLLDNQHASLQDTLHHLLAQHTGQALYICTARPSITDWRLVSEGFQHIGNMRLLLHPAALANIGNDPPNNAAAPQLSETPREETWAEHDYKQR